MIIIIVIIIDHYPSSRVSLFLYILISGIDPPDQNPADAFAPSWIRLRVSAVAVNDRSACRQEVPQSL